MQKNIENYTKDKPNIIFLIIDCLRQDRIGATGYRPDVTPNLNKLYLKGFRATKYFSPGPCTEHAFPSIFTSSLPLDFGGYKEGIHNRPVSFPEILKSENYQTWGAVTGHPCCSHFAYDRGFEKFENLIDLYQWFKRMFYVELREFIEKFKNNKLQKSELIEQIKIEYAKFLDSTLNYINEMENLNLPANGWNRKKLRLQVQQEKKLLTERPEIVCDKILKYDQDCRSVLGLETVNVQTKTKIKIKNKIKNFLNKKITLFSERKAFSANFVNKRFKKFILNREKSKPFFALIHYLDIHEAKLLLSNFSFSNFWNILTSVIPCLNKRNLKSGGLFYDIGASIVDKEVGKLLHLLEKNNLKDNTMIVITGDHGFVAGKPNRNQKKGATDLSKMFFEENISVPLIFYGKNIKPRETTEMGSHIDLAPTLFDIIGIKSSTSFQGKSIYTNSGKKNNFVIAENTGSGICDVKNKNIFICVRSKELKTVYEIKNFKITEREVYDLHNDKWELKNLNKTNLFKDLRNEHFQIVNNRLRKIKLDNNL